jgi:exodeoxyribonuclease-3
MKITTWNVNGIRAREAHVRDWLRLEKPDVMCLQEIKASPHQVPPSLVDAEGYWTYWHGLGGYSGVALLISKELCPVRPEFHSPSFDEECRIIVATLGDVQIASIYVPNGGKDFPQKIRFLEAMHKYVAERHGAGAKLILCGDFNVARAERDVHEKLRDPKLPGQTEGERALLAAILDHGLTDLGRHFAPDDDNLFTWWAPWRNYRERNIGWRLDFVTTSPALTEKAQKCTSLREFGSSDHAPVTAIFEGPLFDPSKVKEGAAREVKPAEGPQLDLFGMPVKK